ncbi:MAG: hypothetical protein WBP77_13765, partial [Candidatus Sulfotelmatobacter sp.]
SSRRFPRSTPWDRCSSGTSSCWHWLAGALSPATTAGASWAPYTPMETTLLQRLVPAEIGGQIFGARHSLVVAAAPLVIAISGLACILAGLGGLVSPSVRQLQRGSP